MIVGYDDQSIICTYLIVMDYMDGLRYLDRYFDGVYEII